VLEEVAEPVAGPGQVVVRVRAASVNFPDALIIEGKYQIRPELPFSPGSELAGEVVAVGEGVTRVRPGDRVAAMTLWGAFAQRIAIPQENVVPLPAALPFDLASALLMTYGTCWHALVERGAIAPGETVLVLGAAGGIGLAAIEIAKARGARVIAAASSAEKLAVCREHGADATIDYSTQNLRDELKALTDGRGVDLVVDPVGGSYSEPALRSMAWRGRFLVIGFADGTVPRIALNLPLLKGCSIVGVFWGDYVRREPAAAGHAIQQLLELVESGRLRPHISGRYPLERAGEAIERLASRAAHGKLIVQP
jgi:NADPH:quinone reductase